MSAVAAPAEARLLDVLETFRLKTDVAMKRDCHGVSSITDMLMLQSAEPAKATV